MSDPKVFHARANHEDMLHIARTALFISFNGFLAVAVGIVDDLYIKIIFALLVVIVDIPWTLWAPNARRFIGELRDAGHESEDERLWRETVGRSERQRRWWKDPMTIISIYVPCALTVGWFLILLHFIWKFSSQWRHAGSGFDLFF